MNGLRILGIALLGLVALASLFSGGCFLLVEQSFGNPILNLRGLGLFALTFAVPVACLWAMRVLSRRMK